MSIRDVYEAVLVEINKENAPNILLEDFNLFFNKAVNLYVNKRYNIYEINQQVTDDLSVLKGTAIYVFKDNSEDSGDSEDLEDIISDDSPHIYYINRNEDNPYLDKSKVYQGLYLFKLPSDYFHILNMTCTYEVTKTWRCYDPGEIFEIGATKLTADAWNLIVNNFWNKPTYRRPYFYIHYGSPKLVKKNKTNKNDKTLCISPEKRNSERFGGERNGHSQDILCELRIGTDKEGTFKLSLITMDYLKVPMFYRLTQSLIDLVEDTSDTLEFPDYVCWEIINELVHIVMENISDLRLQTHPVVSLSIANPTQALAPAATGQTAQ